MRFTVTLRPCAVTLIRPACVHARFSAFAGPPTSWQPFASTVPNDRVTIGQLLAELDPAKLDDTILRSRAALDGAEANVELAQATAIETGTSLARLQAMARLSGGKVPSMSELERAETTHARAEASLRSARAEVPRAHAQLSMEQTDRAKADSRSPINGVVLARQVEPGQTVAASFQTPVLLAIAETLTQMKLEVSVDEADVGQCKPDSAPTSLPTRSSIETFRRGSASYPTQQHLVAQTGFLEAPLADQGAPEGQGATRRRGRQQG